jgi:PKD repeat protein
MKKIYFMLFMAFGNFLSFAQTITHHTLLPQTDFAASTTKVMEGDTLQFNDLSLNSPVSWLWTFDGGTPATSTDKNPKVYYTSHGTYTVTLKATNVYGDDTETKIKYIHVHKYLYGDTANFPLTGDTILYKDSCGYITGNNCRNIIAFANYFRIENDYTYYNLIEQALFQFAKVACDTANHEQIKIIVWDTTGVNSSPGNVLNVITVPLNSIVNDVASNNLTSGIMWYFYPYPCYPVVSFYLGVVLPVLPRDSLALYSNHDGDTIPGIAWEQWADSTWHPMKDSNSVHMNLDLAIFPKMNCFVNDIKESSSANEFAVFPNPVSDRINLRFREQIKNARIKIYNVIGDLILNENININSNHYSLDLQQYDSGIYFLKIETSIFVGTQKITIRD